MYIADVIEAQLILNTHLITKILVALIAIVLIMAVIDYFSPGIFQSDYLARHALIAIAQNLALITLLINGTLIETRNFKVILIAIGGTILGAIMKIMHFPGADGTIIISNVMVLIAYSSHFSFKQNKQALDFLKLLSVILLFGPGAMYTLDKAFTREILFTGNIVLAITFIYFLITNRRTVGSA